MEASLLQLHYTHSMTFGICDMWQWCNPGKVS